MNPNIFLFAAAIFLFSGIYFQASTVNPKEEIVTEFAHWRSTYGKTYADIKEENYRFKNFEETYLFVKNFVSTTQTVELNEFSDLSRKEFAALYLGLKLRTERTNEVLEDESETGSIPVSNGVSSW